jgi:mannose-1-phosphate guanylyltransferase / mannose-6-phosphate isomerase
MSAQETILRQIHPVILSGGVGSRLWPLSREHYPKQLLPLAGEQSLIQQTARRVVRPARFGSPVVICNHEHRFVIAEQLAQVGVTPEAMVLEPEGRNTMPAAAVAALLVAERFGPDAMLLLLPSDHLVRDEAAFHAAVETAAAAAGTGQLITFGIAPNAPETGFGYIRRGPALNGVPGAHKIDRFVEKPDRATAQGYLADGGYSWNSGMFLFRAGDLLGELARFEAAALDACRQSLALAKRDADFLRLDAAAFGLAAAKSLDVAVMERTQIAAVVPADFGWSDVGSWSALADIAAKDAAGNTVLGDAIVRGATGCYVRSSGVLTAVLGIDNVVVVATDDAVLVVAKDKTQQIKGLVDELRALRRPEAVSHRRMYRPWGWHQTLDLGDRFRVKHIMVKPGHSLSLQKHYHRAEHWVVVYGVAEVTRGAEISLVHENQSIFVPIGTVHRLHNPGKLPLSLIEVQSGSYLGEDDIVRLEDRYGR